MRWTSFCWGRNLDHIWVCFQIILIKIRGYRKITVLMVCSRLLCMLFVDVSFLAMTSIKCVYLASLELICIIQVFGNGTRKWKWIHQAVKQISRLENFCVLIFLCLNSSFYVQKNFLLMPWLRFSVCWLRFKSTTAAATSMKLSARCSRACGQFVCLSGLLKWLLNK